MENEIEVDIISAKREIEKISSRTKLALAHKKSLGFKLGSPENLTDEARQRSIEVRKLNAKNSIKNKQILEKIKILCQDNLTNYAIAKKLNEEGTTTRYGKKFTHVTVKRFVDRI